MLKKQLDKLFWKFADEKFSYGGTYPYQTELVFAFADYIDQLRDEDLSALSVSATPTAIRRIVRRGVDKWLQKNAKTMMIL